MRPTIKFEHAADSQIEDSFYCFHLIAVGDFKEDFSARIRLIQGTAGTMFGDTAVIYMIYIITYFPISSC